MIPTLLRLTAVSILIAPLAPTRAAGTDGKHPLFLGVQACAACHSGVDTGHQFSRWHLSAHARAFASLALPQAGEIARLSGIPEEPQQARMCLGCHATAADTEPWERTEAFRVQDGLQCEGCHGPGSEYAVAEVMMDRAESVRRGLVIPDTEDSCMMCHRVKGSHEAVLQKAPFDLATAWPAIAHPFPGETSDAASASPPPEPLTSTGDFRFAGVQACATCHDGPRKNYQFSRWRLSAHSRAFAVLSTPRAIEIAQDAGVKTDPQTSAECLPCHTTGYGQRDQQFLASFSQWDGVQCEACHGAGSEYSLEAIMLDKTASAAAGLVEVTPSTCQSCHDPQRAHGEPFDYTEAVQTIAHPTRPSPSSAQVPYPRYKTPINLALTPNGHELWVACESADTVIVIDTESLVPLAEIPVGRQPHDVAFDPDGRYAFVSNRLDDQVSVVDVATRGLVRTLEVGDEPHGLLVDPQGENLYVLNTSIDNVSVIELATYEEIKRLPASRSPWSLAFAPDGAELLVTHALSRFVDPLEPSLSEVMVIDPALARVEDRWLAPAANLLQGVAWHPSGEFALVTLLRTKNRVPMTRVARGWTLSNGLGIVWRHGTVDQVLLDQPDQGFADPADVAITSDGRMALVTSSGTDRVAVVDLDKLTELIRAATPYERERVLPNHLGKSTEFVTCFIPTGISPRGVVCAANSRVAYVANALDDSVTVLDLARLEATQTIDLGGPKELTQARYGEQVFHSARITFHRMFSCHTCHPDGHIDGITYDIEPDGIGLSPVDNRSLRGINDTAPFKWEGTNPSLKRQCGPRLSVFFTRIQPFTPEELAAVDRYICTIPRPPNRYRELGAPLSDAQRRGRDVFYRTHANDGREIARENRCVTCHPPPLYTDSRVHDVGTRQPNDRDAEFDSPHLHNIYDSAPYLHNGVAQTLEEIWTTYNPYDQHGVANDMTKDQLNDLVEFLKTL
jgi:YVTN family beta-propeller protein